MICSICARPRAGFTSPEYGIVHKSCLPIPEKEPKICAYPPCRKLFIPKKSNQICCKPRHTFNIQQARTKARRKARNAQSQH